MVQMSDRQFPIESGRQFKEHIEQHHRIHSPGDRHQQLLTRQKQPARANRSFDLLCQMTHQPMLLAYPFETKNMFKFAMCDLLFRAWGKMRRGDHAKFGLPALPGDHERRER